MPSPRTFTGLVFLLGLLTLPNTLWAQTPFLYRMDHPATGSVCRVLDLKPLGAGQYGLVVRVELDGAYSIGRATLAADGSLSDTSVVILGGSYGTPVVQTGNGYLQVRESVDSTRTMTLLKTDAVGNVAWTHYFPDNYGRFLTDVPDTWVEKDGGYYGLGHRQDVPPTEGYASYLLHVNGDGTFTEAWTYAGGDGWSDLGRGLVRTADNGLAGVSVQRPYFSASSFPNISVQRWNAAMGLEWSKLYSMGNYHLVHSTTATADGGIILTGLVAQYMGAFKSFMMKLDSTGQVLWAHCSTTESPVVSQVVERPDGQLWMAGNTDFLGAPGNALVALLGSDGSLVGADALTGTGDQFVAQGLVVDPFTGALLVPGYFSTVPQGPMGVARVDTLLQMACTSETFTWTDSVVTPVVNAFPITLVADTLTSIEVLRSVQTTTFRTTAECLSTAVAPPPTSRASSWIAPGHGPLHIAAPDATTAYAWSILDVAGRCLATGGSAGHAQQINTGFEGTGVHVLLIQQADGARHVERFFR